MNVYSSRKYLAENGRGDSPGDRDAYRAAIAFTPLDEVWTAFGPDDRARIRAQARRDATAVAFLPTLLASKNGFYDTPPAELRRRLADLLEAHEETLRLLEELGADPNP